MASRRVAERDIQIDYSRQNKRRRARFKNDPARFCSFYFPSTFYNPFCDYHYEIIQSIVDAIMYSLVRAIAAPRGGGKSSLVKCVLGVWAIVYGHIKWPMVIKANYDPEAKDFLADIKSYYEEPDSEDFDLFGDDFPEICQPIRALEGSSRRGESQTVDGRLTRIKWGMDEIVFPDVKGSAAAKATLTPMSIEKPVRGKAKRNKRIEIALLDDVETDDSVLSYLQTEKIHNKIHKGVLPTSGQRRGVGVLMVGTIMNWRSLIARYTDREKSPIWNGKRFSFFKTWPENRNMWDKYVYILQRDGITEANKYYLANRKAMDAGAVVCNDHWFSKSLGADGKPIEYSAIQKGFNEIAKMGMPAFMCEFQNDPIPDENDAMEIKPSSVSEKVNGISRGEIPSGTYKLTAYIDVHDKSLYWAVVAVKQGFCAMVVDYGVESVESPVSGSMLRAERDKATELAVYDSLLSLRGVMSKLYNYDILLVDSGWRTQCIYAACKAFGGGKEFPSKGMPSSSYKTPRAGTDGVRMVGKGQYQSAIKNDGVWLTIINADYYKRMVQEGFGVDDWDKPGSFSLFGSDPHEHRAIAEHVTDEQWNVEKGKYEGVGGKKAHNNHWLDCLAGCCAGAGLCGVKMIHVAQPKSRIIRPSIKINSHKPLRTRY